MIRKTSILHLFYPIRLDTALYFIFQSRLDFSSNNSIWDLKFHWSNKKPLICQNLQKGSYNFHPFKLISYLGSRLIRTNAKDDVVIKGLQTLPLKHVIKTVYKDLAKLKLGIARNKTEVGQTTRTCTFLGYRLGAKKLQVSVDSQKRASEKIVQLYKRGASKRRIEQHLTRRHIWAQSGLSGCVIKLELPSWITKLLQFIKS